MSAVDLCRIVVDCRAANRSFRQGRTDAWGAFTGPGYHADWRDVLVWVSSFTWNAASAASVQYAKARGGAQGMGGQSTHLPLRVNSGGVMPVIFRLLNSNSSQTLAFWPAQQPLFGD